MSQPIPPPPPRGGGGGGGFYHMVISGYLDHQSTQFRLSASELLLFVSVVLVLINATWNSKLLWPYSFIMTKKAISIYCFIVWTVTHVLVPIYILQALNMRTGLNQLTMSSVTYFISQANAGIRFSQDKRNWKVWRGFGKNEGEWTGEAEIRTRKKLWQWLSILGYILTYSVLLRENIHLLWVFNREDLNISASTVPNNKDTFKTKKNGKLQYIKLFKQ